MEENEKPKNKVRKSVNYGKILIFLGVILLCAGTILFVLGNQLINEGNIEYATVISEAHRAVDEGANERAEYYIPIYIRHAIWNWDDGLYFMNISKIVLLFSTLCFSFGSIGACKKVDKDDKITKLAYIAISITLIYFIMQLVLYQPELASIDPFIM